MKLFRLLTAFSAIIYPSLSCTPFVSRGRKLGNNRPTKSALTPRVRRIVLITTPKPGSLGTAAIASRTQAYRSSAIIDHTPVPRLIEPTAAPLSTPQRPSRKRKQEVDEVVGSGYISPPRAPSAIPPTPPTLRWSGLRNRRTSLRTSDESSLGTGLRTVRGLDFGTDLYHEFVELVRGAPSASPPTEEEVVFHEETGSIPTPPPVKRNRGASRPQEDDE